jgi:hypothetical protein
LPEVLPSAMLTQSDRRQMYELLEAYFESTSFRQFELDLSEKDTVILLRDPEDARVVGFSTLMKLSIMVEQRRVAGFFQATRSSRGNAGDRRCWDGCG